MSQYKFKPILGALPEQGATDWWTEKDWKEHYAYVEKLKKEGKYLTEGEEVTINLKGYKGFEDNRTFNDAFSNLGILIPGGVMPDDNPSFLQFDQRAQEQIKKK